MLKQEWFGPRNLATQRGLGGAALANSTTLTAISPNPQFTLNTGELTAGDVLRWTAWGVYSTTTGPPTINLGLYYGSATIGSATAIVTTGAINTTASATTVPWRIWGETVVRSIGTSGSVISQGVCALGSSVSAFSTPVPMPNVALATVTVDTTLAAPTWQVGGTWGTASASNTIQCLFFMVE